MSELARICSEKIVDKNDPFILEVEKLFDDSFMYLIGNQIDLTRAEEEGWDEKKKLWYEAQWELQREMKQRIKKKPEGI